MSNLSIRIDFLTFPSSIVQYPSHNRHATQPFRPQIFLLKVSFLYIKIHTKANYVFKIIQKIFLFHYNHKIYLIIFIIVSIIRTARYYQHFFLFYPFPTLTKEKLEDSYTLSTLSTLNYNQVLLIQLVLINIITITL